MDEKKVSHQWADTKESGIERFIDVNKILEGELSKSSLDDETRKKIIEKIKTLKEKVTRGDILKNTDAKSFLVELRKEIEETTKVLGEKSKGIAHEVDEKIKAEGEAFKKAIQDNLDIISESIKEAVGKRGELKKETKQEEKNLAMSVYEPVGFFESLKRFWQKIRGSKEKKEEKTEVKNQDIDEVMNDRDEKTEELYSKQLENDEQIKKYNEDYKKLEADLKSFVEKLADMRKETMRRVREMYDNLVKAGNEKVMLNNAEKTLEGLDR